jgi:hypothetical protein
MSGWIKLEKSLLTDMRFRRMVDRYVEQSNALRNAAVTVMLGALAQLWLYADEHIHDDDTVRATTDDIDRFVGVDQFCSMVPKDWLVVLNPDQIQLPDFLAHNGTSARSRKLNAERQARFRHRHGNGKGNGSVTHSNARNDAKPDQTILDQTRKNTTAAMRPTVPVEFSDLQLIYPKRSGANPWDRALRACTARLKSGSTWSEMLEGARRYQAYCRQTLKIGTEFVMQAATFFGPSRHFAEPWDLPANKAETLRDENLEASQEWLRASNR